MWTIWRVTVVDRPVQMGGVPHQFRWSIPRLAPGAEEILRFKLRAPRSGDYVQTVSATASNGVQGTAKHATLPVPEKESAYPENRMFGASLPAYGLYLRHAGGLTLDNTDRTLRAGAGAGPEPVAEEVGYQPGLPVNELERSVDGNER